MKLEAIDPLNLGNICVATICKVSQAASSLQAAFSGWRQCRAALHVHPTFPTPPAAPGAPDLCEEGSYLLPAQNLLSC